MAFGLPPLANALPDEVRVIIWPERENGGQQVCLTPTGIKMVHEGHGITIIVTTHRSVFRNTDIATKAMMAALTHPLMPK